MDHSLKQKKNEKLKETGDSGYTYQNEMDKACFQRDIDYGDFKDLPRRTASDKVLRDKAFNIAKNQKCDGCQRGLALVVYKFFNKKLLVVLLKNEITLNQQLVEELHKPIIRKFQKRKVHSSFKDNVWGTDLADMQLISKFNKEFQFLLCVIGIYSKYAWVVPLKDKKGITNTNAFQQILDESNRKSNKIWVDKGSEFYNRSVKSWLHDNDIEMYSAIANGNLLLLKDLLEP